MSAVLFKFPSARERTSFLSLVESYAQTLRTDATKATDISEDLSKIFAANAVILESALEHKELDPQVKTAADKLVALFVSGQKLVEGTMADMTKKFIFESGAHKATVELRECVDGVWKTIRRRNKAR